MRVLLTGFLMLFFGYTALAIQPVTDTSSVKNYRSLQAMPAAIGFPLKQKNGFKSGLKQRLLFWLVKQKLKRMRKADKTVPTKLGTVSLLSSIIGVLLLFVGLGAFLPVIGLFGAAIVLGILSLKKERSNAKAIIGIILGSLGILVFIAALIWIIIIFSSGFGIE